MIDNIKPGFWFTFSRALKYFVIIFFSLVLVLALVLIAIYSSMTDPLLSVPTSTLINKIILTMGILVLVSVIYSGYLLTAAIKQKHKEDQLKILNKLLGTTSDFVILHSVEGIIISSNQAAHESLGYSKEEFARTNIYTNVDEEYTKHIGKELRQLLEKGEVEYESTYIKKNKTHAFVNIKSRIVKLNSENLILSSVRDITDSKRTTDELEQSSAKLQRAMEGTINAIALTTEVRDPYTAGHQQRVTKLAVAIAAEMGLPESQIEGIRVAGNLHDIGTIYVPAEILSKPGKLKKNEFNLVKDHAEVGYDLLKSIEFPWPVANIVIQHHEGMDGSGYPQGLKGDDIMLESAIIAVADVIESMASHRPYRPAYNIDKALMEILQKKGVLYHPGVVDACLKIFNEGRFAF